MTNINSSLINNMKVLHTYIIFTFDSMVHNGHFVHKRRSGIITDLGDNHQYSAMYNRTGRVLVIGDKVTTVNVGDQIAIQSLMWTPHAIEIDGQKCWMTDERYVLGIVATAA